MNAGVKPSHSPKRGHVQSFGNGTRRADSNNRLAEACQRWRSARSLVVALSFVELGHRK